MVKAEILLIGLMCLVGESIEDGNYDPNTDDVVELSQENFKSEVLNSDDSWLVVFEFPGPGCPYCIDLSTTVKKAVPLLKEKNLKVGFVDATRAEGRALTDSYKITGFPKMYIFRHDKGNPTIFPYNPKSEVDLANTAAFLLNKPAAAEGKCGKDTTLNEETNTYELTDENFKEVVLSCKGPWMINFYTPDKELCTNFIPYFEAAAKEFKGKVRFGSFYQPMSKVAAKYKAQMICTVKLFLTGNKKVKPLDYNKGYHSSDLNKNLIPWIKKKLGVRRPGTPAPETSPPAPETSPSAPETSPSAPETSPSAPATSPPATGKVSELTSQKDLDLNCRKPEVTRCFFLFIANDDQCNDDCKLTQQDQLTRVSDTMKEEIKMENFAWFFSTDENQQDFQQTFGVKGFPGVIAIDRKSNTYSFVRGNLPDDNHLVQFALEVVSGKLSSKTLPFVYYDNTSEEQ